MIFQINTFYKNLKIPKPNFCIFDLEFDLILCARNPSGLSSPVEIKLGKSVPAHEKYRCIYR